MVSRLSLVAALAFSALAGTSAARAEETITIGFTAALSGDFAAFGLNMRKGLDLAVKELNAANAGVKYEVVSADDRGEAREGVLIAQRFCSDKAVDVVMGYSFSSIALAAVPVLNDCKLPVLASAVTSPDLTGVSPYFRRNVLTDAVQGALMGKYAAGTLGLKKIYILNQQDDYGIGVAGAFKEAAAGAEIVGEDSYLLGTKDFKTLLTKIKATKPDAIFIGGFYTEAAKIAEQAKALGIQVQLLGTDGSLNPELVSLGRDAVEGMIVYGMFDPSVATAETGPFLTAYKDTYKEDPSAWAALGYDAGKTLAAAVTLAAGKGEVTRESLNTAFGDVKDVPGVTGPTTFESTGDRAGALYFLKVSGGKFSLVK